MLKNFFINSNLKETEQYFVEEGKENEDGDGDLEKESHALDSCQTFAAADPQMEASFQSD